MVTLTIVEMLSKKQLWHFKEYDDFSKLLAAQWKKTEYGYIILRTGTGTITNSNSRSGRALIKIKIRTPQDRPLSFLSFREKN
jgi:hypothetical protein